MIRACFLSTAIAALAMPAAAGEHDAGYSQGMSYGVRPFHLIAKMADSPLKADLLACMGQTPARSGFSIGHRGAPLMFPEHTVESNRAAAGQGAGILECDVTFTADKELVCRHAQNDLHTTTNIVVTDLAAKCTTPFTPASGDTAASAECRTSDLTLAEFRTLTPTMDAANGQATTPEEYVGGVAPWRTTLYENDATLMTHAESIALFDQLGADFTPELKGAAVEMPFDGFSQEDYAQKMIDEYKDAQRRGEIDPSIDPMDAATFKPTMAELKEMGVNYIAPPLWMLVTLDDAGEMIPSVYAEEAKAAGLRIITWTLERSGPLASGGGWYFQSVEDAIDTDGDYFEILDVLAQDVGVVGVFSDWPATVTYYANCKGL